MYMTKGGVADTKVAIKQQPVSNTTKTDTAQRGSEDALNKVQGYVNKWLEYRKKLTPNWERDTKLFHNERYKKHYHGLADSFVPMARSTVETIYASIGTADLSTQFVPQDIYKYLKDRLMPGYSGIVVGDDGAEKEETEEEYLVRAIKATIGAGVIKDESMEVLNDLYKYVWDTRKWRKHVRKMVKSGLKIGNGALWMYLDKGLPNIRVVPFPDFVFDPDSTDDDTGVFKGRRYLTSLNDLKKETIVDPVSGKIRKRYSLKGVTAKSLYSDDKTDKQFKEELLFGSTSGSSADSDQVEVIELRANDRQYVLINRSILAEDIENPFITQARLRGIDQSDLILFPCITWANYEDDSLYIGESEISLMWKEQERLNDNTNQRSDAVTQSLLRQKRADPALKPQKNSMEVPGAVIWATQGQYEAVSPDQVPSAAFAEESSIKNNIREVTATDQIVKGMGSSKDITATEAQLQVANSNERNDIKIDSLVDGPLDRIARLALQYIRLFIADPYIFTPKENGGVKPSLYDPKKFNYVFEPKVTLTVSAQSKRKQEQREASEIYKMLIQDPTNNLKEVKRIMLPKIVDLDNDEIDRIVDNTDTPTPPPPASQLMTQPIPQGVTA